MARISASVAARNSPNGVTPQLGHASSGWQRLFSGSNVGFRQVSDEFLDFVATADKGVAAWTRLEDQESLAARNSTDNAAEEE